VLGNTVVNKTQIQSEAARVTYARMVCIRSCICMQKLQRQWVCNHHIVKLFQNFLRVLCVIQKS